MPSLVPTLRLLCWWCWKEPLSKWNAVTQNLQNIYHSYSIFQDSYTVGAYPCHETVSASQFFSFSKNYQLRREDSCAEIGALAGTGFEVVKMVQCSISEDQQWIHTKQGRLIHKTTNKCLDVVMVDSQQQLYAAPCKAVSTQIWFFDAYFSWEDNESLTDLKVFGIFLFHSKIDA